MDGAGTISGREREWYKEDMPVERGERRKRGKEKGLTGGGGGGGGGIMIPCRAACMQIYMHTYIHACIHTYMHTYIPTENMDPLPTLLFLWSEM